MATVLEQHREQVADLCRRFNVTRLVLFGSAADPARFDPATSDFDFLVEFGPPPPGLHVGKQYLRFLAALEELLGRHVDLVEESAIRNPYFRLGVERSPKVLMYAA